MKLMASDASGSEYLQHVTCYTAVWNRSLQFCTSVENDTNDKDLQIVINTESMRLFLFIQVVCRGIHGGPLMMFTSSRQRVLVGITLMTCDCFKSRYSIVQKWVTLFLEWIRSTQLSNATEVVIFGDNLNLLLVVIPNYSVELNDEDMFLKSRDQPFTFDLEHLHTHSWDPIWIMTTMIVLIEGLMISLRLVIARVVGLESFCSLRSIRIIDRVDYVIFDDVLSIYQKVTWSIASFPLLLQKNTSCEG